MKNFISTLKNKVTALAVRVHSNAVCAQTAIANDNGDFYISDGGKSHHRRGAGRSPAGSYDADLQ